MGAFWIWVLSYEIDWEWLFIVKPPKRDWGQRRNKDVAIIYVAWALAIGNAFLIEWLTDIQHKEQIKTLSNSVSPILSALTALNHMQLADLFTVAS